MCGGGAVFAEAPPPNVPQIEFYDALGVDLLSLTVPVPAPKIASSGMAFNFTGQMAPYRNNYSDALIVQEDPYVEVTHDHASFEGKSYQFSPAGVGPDGLWKFAPERQTQGASLTQVNATTYQLITPEGTLVTYSNAFISSNYSLGSVGKSSNPDNAGYLATAISAVRSDGEKIYYHYSSDNSNGTKNLKAISSSLGWIVKIDSRYGARKYGTTTWLRSEPTKVYMINSAIDYCDPLAASCSSTSSNSRREINISTSDGFEFIYKNKDGVELFRNRYGSDGTPKVPGGYRFPSGRSMVYNRDGFGIFPVQNGNIISGSSTWSYFRAPVDVTGANSNPLLYTQTVTSSDPYFKVHSAKFTFLQQVPIESIDELSRKTMYEYDGDHYLVKIIYPDATYSGSVVSGGYTTYFYDSRRNLTEIRAYPKTGGLPAIQKFTYENFCNEENFRFCNKVKIFIDANQNSIEYTYSAEHGGILSETYPPDANGVRKQIRYSYTKIAPAMALSGGGATVDAPIWRISKKSECANATKANASSCIGTKDEIIEEYFYNNINLTRSSQKNSTGNGDVKRIENFTYDYFGMLTSSTVVMTSYDTTKYNTYDADGRKIFEISAKSVEVPATRQVVKHVYDADGREAETQTGYGAKTDGSDFIWQKKTKFTYDVSTGKVSRVEEIVP